jgi:hypothetical protein
MPPYTLLVLPEDGEHTLRFALTLYPAGPAETGILRPKHRFPTGGYLRPTGCFPTMCMGGRQTWGKRECTKPCKNPGNSPCIPGTGGEAYNHSVRTSPRRGRCTQSRGKGASRAEGGGREDPEPGDPTTGETRRFTAVRQRVRRNPKNTGHRAKVRLPHCRPWEKPQPTGERSACPWKCRTHTRWAMALCPISGSSEDPRHGGEEGNSPPVKTTGSLRTKGGAIEGGTRTQSPQAGQRVCQGYAQATLIPIYQGTMRRDREGGTQRGHRRKGR